MDQRLQYEHIKEQQKIPDSKWDLYREAFPQKE